MHFTRSVVLAATMAVSAAVLAAEQTIDVLSFNIWHSDTGGAAARANIVEVIRRSQASVVGLQELNRAADGEAIRQALGPGWYFHHSSDLGFLSRYPISAVSPQRLGVRLDVAGQPLWVFNAHLAHAPYGPYQLAGIAYFGGPLRDPRTSAGVNAVVADQQARVREAQNYLEDMRRSGALGDSSTVLLGDFNEPSHLDWSARAAQAGLQRAVVPWPTSRTFVEAGFLDSYRTVFPDEVAQPGPTWSPLYGPSYRDTHYPAGVTEPQDRIDLIYHRGTRLSALDAGLVGPSGDALARIAYGQGIGYGQAGQFPSDHRGVWVRLRLRDPVSTRLDFAGLPHNPGNDSALNQGYGDRAAATPAVTVRFQAYGGAYWDSYDSSRGSAIVDSNWAGGVAQLQSGGSGSYHDFVLTPDAGTSVVLERFRLLDYQYWAGGHSVGWWVLDASGTTLASGTATVPTDGTVMVETGLSAARQGEITLRLAQLSGDGSDLAIDDIEFRQR
ncbi:endonuclease/exonuclease/phosphatase family protein [Chitinimonas lacunae]|uniref:Endonuclease/exonuclease/phosphatase family protein n=1 Tax=Chitinimonas lacunae TaxID=1963018 RepID=A0ABV8MTX6_9NEIS